jgi:hypothetical protein
MKLLALVGAILVLLIAMGRPPAGPPSAAASHGGPWHVVQRVSVASDGTEGNGDSWLPSISADGRYVAFESEASNLVPGDTNGTWDIFVAAAVEPTAMRLLWGDVNCSGGVDAVDALQLLRYTVRLPVLQQEPCPDIGDTVSVDGTPRLWGDVDGDGEVNAVDALKILRYVVMLRVQQQPGTPPIGREVEVGEQRCDPSYPTVCIPPPPPDLDCRDIPYRNFVVRPPDPHRFDRDGDGIGCEE